MKPLNYFVYFMSVCIVWITVAIQLLIDKISYMYLTTPSPPSLPLPVTFKATSISHHS